jgi:hypothetical protein
MDLERRRTSIYGQQTKLIHEAGSDLAEMLRAAKQRALAAEREKHVNAAAIEGGGGGSTRNGVTGPTWVHGWVHNVVILDYIYYLSAT